MRIRGAIFLLALLVFPSLATANNSAPKSLHIRLGGFSGASHSLDLEGYHIAYRFNPNTYTRLEDKAETITISEEKWSEFRKVLDKNDVWNWRENYYNSEVFDGTQWNIEIAYDEKSIKASGSNAYPLADGSSNNAPEYTDSFKNILAAISKLVGKEIK